MGSSLKIRSRPMSHDDTTLVLGMDDIQPSESLPEFISRRWNFPLQQHERDDTKYYSIRDWIVGITDSTPDKARVVWKDFKRLHENAGGVVSLALPYLASDGKPYETDFTDDEGLYKIAVGLRVSKNRPALRAIKDFLAKAGVFVDEARRDPERASEQLGIARRNQALSSGKSEEWIATRETGVVTRKQFTSAIHSLVQDKKRFGIIIAGITNQTYRGVFESDVKGLRQRLGITAKENPRDHFSRIALAYTTIAEESMRIYLGSYDDRAFVPVHLINNVVASISAAIGVQVKTVAQALGIDALTGHKASDKQLTQGELGEFNRLLNRASQPRPKESG